MAGPDLAKAARARLQQSRKKINDIVEQIAVDIVKELKREHLTTSGETFLEWQRPYVEDHIASDDPVLKSL